jgi:hypothetical protein
VDELNKHAHKESGRMISDVSPLMHLGYFPLKSIMEEMNIKKWVDFFKLTANYEFDLYELLASLVYVRGVHPASKRRTFHVSLIYPKESKRLQNKVKYFRGDKRWGYLKI